MNKLSVSLATIFILLSGIASSFGQTVSDEAKRYFDRGVAAVEMAKTPADFESAIKEFKQAATLAPDWPDVYFNLGLVQEKAGNYSDAAANLKQYIRLAPNASDAEMVKTLINKLEYKRDVVDKKKGIINSLTAGTIRKTGGSSGGICWIGKFIQSGEGLKANIICMKSNYNQTVPVEFDGSVLKFNYIYYGCPNMPASYEYYPCPWKVSIVAEVTSSSPLCFKVKEVWNRAFNEAYTESYDAEWEFIQ